MGSNCTRMLDFDTLFRSDNVRTPECEDIPGMVASLRRPHGFKVNHPLVVSQKDSPDGLRYLVLVGNRRTKGLEWLREHDLPAFNSALAVCKGKVPAVVHRNLLPEQEVLIRIDHGKDEDRVPLDEYSLYQAIKQLVQQADATQERIAESLGLYIQRGKRAGQPNRSWVQVRTNLVRLPTFVEQEYRKLTLEGKEATHFRMAHVAELYKVFNEEYLTYRNGDGPEFTALWHSILHPEEKAATDAPNAGDAKELTPAEAVKRSQSASSDTLKTALLVVTKQSKVDLASIDARMVAAETALLTLNEIQEYLGVDDYNSLVDNARKQSRAKEDSPASETEDSLTHDTEYEHPVEV